MRNSTLRFSDRVDNYVKYSPGYPAEVLDFFKAELGILPTHQLVDVGSGTGISTKVFLENGNSVFAVEPNQPMREAAERLLAGFSRMRSVPGSAEKTGLPDRIADFIIAAQAFHWFEPLATRTEFRRILKPKGYVVLLWNDRDTKNSPFAIAYEELIQRFATDYAEVNHKNIDPGQGFDPLRLGKFLGTYKQMHFPNFQDLEFDGLVGRLASSSYVPKESTLKFKEMVTGLKALFDKFCENGRVRIDYQTKIYYAQWD